MEDTKYICIRDLQGGSFAVGAVETIEGWLNRALTWCDSDDNEEYAEFLKGLAKYSKNNIVGEIASMWQLEIIPVEDLPIGRIWKFIEEICDREYSIKAIANRLQDNEDREFIETIVNTAKDIESEIEKE